MLRNVEEGKFLLYDALEFTPLGVDFLSKKILVVSYAQNFKENTLLNTSNVYIYK